MKKITTINIDEHVLHALDNRLAGVSSRSAAIENLIRNELEGDLHNE